MVLFRYYLLVGDTAAPSGLYAGLCHAFVVLLIFMQFLACENRSNFYYVNGMNQRLVNVWQHQNVIDAAINKQKAINSVSACAYVQPFEHFCEFLMKAKIIDK